MDGWMPTAISELFRFFNAYHHLGISFKLRLQSATRILLSSTVHLLNINEQARRRCRVVIDSRLGANQAKLIQLMIIRLWQLHHKWGWTLLSSSISARPLSKCNQSNYDHRFHTNTPIQTFLYYTLGMFRIAQRLYYYPTF